MWKEKRKGADEKENANTAKQGHQPLDTHPLAPNSSELGKERGPRLAGHSARTPISSARPPARGTDLPWAWPPC